VIRAIANKRLDLSDSEYSYFLAIKNSIGDEDFKKLFTTNKNGIITSVSPPLDKPINVAVIYFILNVMVNQRLNTIEGRVNNFIKNMDDPGVLTRLVERVEALEEKFGGSDE
jgi:hypothetical protein